MTLNRRTVNKTGELSMSGLINKFVVAEKMETNDEEMSVVGWGSKPVPDRDKELIESNAWILDEYRKNPVVMLCHDYSVPPVGKSLWVKADANGLRFKVKFANTDRGKELYSLYKDGIMNAFSVGFAPMGSQNDNPSEGKYKGMGLKRVYTKVNLLEVSCVPIPSNPEALVDRIKSGKIQTKQLKEELEHVMELIEKNPIQLDEVVPAIAVTEPVVATGTVVVEDKVITEPIIEEVKVETEVKDNVVEEGMKITEIPDEEVEVVSKYLDAYPERVIEYLVAKGYAYPVDSPIAMESSVTKMTDPSGNPSIYDIITEINKFLNSPANTMGGNCWYSVIDLFPLAYPNGSVIYSCNEKGEVENLKASYIYDSKMRCAEVLDDAVPVEQSWIFERYTEVEEVQKSIVKEGRILSSKNKKMIKDCIAKMDDTCSVLKALHDSTERVADDIVDDTKEVDDFEIIEKEVKEIEITEEMIASIVAKGVNSAIENKKEIDLSELIENQILKMKGKVIK